MSSLDSLRPEIREGAIALFDLALKAGVKPRVTSVVRSYALQKSLYEAFLQGRARFPAAPPGTSAHEYGYAFDLVVDGAANQQDLGAVWRSWGGVYGGEEDPVHFEASGFKSWLSGQGIQTSSPGPASNQSTRDMLAKLVDLFLASLPGWVGGIVSTAGLSNSIYGIARGKQSTMLLWLSHPQEFFDAVYDLWWSIVSSYL